MPPNDPATLSQHEWLRRAFIPIAVVLCAAAAELALTASNGERAPLLVLLTCVWAIAWLSGLRAGLIATAVAGVASIYFFIPPTHSFHIVHGSDAAQISLFAAQGVLASVFCEMRRRAIAAREEALARERKSRAESTRCRQELKKARADWNGVLAALITDLASGATGPDLSAALAAYSNACEVEQGNTVVNTGELWDEAVANCRRKLDRPIVLKRGLKQGDMPEVRATAATLIQAFECLAAAAAAVTPPDRPVELSIAVGKMPGEWTFSVSDEGNGGEPRDRTLSLATCRRLLESQGGRIWTPGRLGGGTTCVFSLPRVS
jgi:signal transduction histidine kinase